MEAQATAKYIRVSPRKALLVARNVNGQPVEQAMDILKFTPNKAAGIIYKVMRSALANAEQAGSDVGSLRVKQVVVNEGPTMKRFMPRSQGRANTILKRTSHITVILAAN
ncbi:MAG: 50S ribosomal protein L22 [Deltaproteobacteria bacterium]|jgi:large subunit ribosomal protein L22|nr:50S ribosomal protein L22 [Deltaproteobacteria bacterium]